MNKIASPVELQAELRRLLAYSQTAKPSREKLAAGMRGLADRVGSFADVLEFVGKTSAGGLRFYDVHVAYSEGGLFGGTASELQVGFQKVVTHVSKVMMELIGELTPERTKVTSWSLGEGESVHWVGTMGLTQEAQVVEGIIRPIATRYGMKLNFRP